MFIIISGMSSTMPGMLESSCSTPSMRTAQIATPSSEETNTRRSALPIVIPNPRSRGKTANSL